MTHHTHNVSLVVLFFMILFSLRTRLKTIHDIRFFIHPSSHQPYNSAVLSAVPPKKSFRGIRASTFAVPRRACFIYYLSYTQHYIFRRSDANAPFASAHIAPRNRKNIIKRLPSVVCGGDDHKKRGHNKNTASVRARVFATTPQQMPRTCPEL